MPGKDRRTRMVTSSFKAPAKQDGAGGSHTWGGPKDVTDYASVRTSVSKVSVGPAPASVADHQRSALPSQKLYLKDIRQFPDLGAKPAPIAVKWVPAATTHSRASHGKRLCVQIRKSCSTLAFARRARSAEGRSAGAQHQMSIDWSAAGTSAVTQAWRRSACVTLQRPAGWGANSEAACGAASASAVCSVSADHEGTGETTVPGSHLAKSCRYVRDESDAH